MADSQDVPKPDPSATALPGSEEVVGGFPFFLSLVALLPTGLLFTVLALVRLRYADPVTCTAFILATLAGAFLAHIAIKGHISVLLHEFKHSLVSNLAGNKHKGMTINENSGYYRWAYTKRTAHLNAFIALAPYFVPAFSFVGTLFVLALFRNERVLAVCAVGLGYGMDLVLNLRDISPIQTDITLIRGGYKVGLLYIAAWNLLIAGLMFAWAFQGTEGLIILFEDLSTLFVYLYFSIFGEPS